MRSKHATLSYTLPACPQEAGLLASLRHPNCITFLAVCRSPPCIITGAAAVEGADAQRFGDQGMPHDVSGCLHTLHQRRAWPFCMHLPFLTCCASAPALQSTALAAR